ncbi:hypothetical protein GCM10023085_64100 [Actinomadura viridis]|uniref:Uncharacterized protein n=1 Tax=Actinomadura viridis TaxID=58110 RepID=A0A931DP28_9ACTN|nr:hypothetical protein [Actinomadura viridis]MBG6093172.1 hypothetical protein [Actinomadura viridis]
MAYEVILVFADSVHPEEFLDLIEELGGVRRPDEWTSGRLSRERRHVWVTVAPSPDLEFEPEDLEEYERKLGAPMRAAVILSISTTKGSDAVAMEIFEAAARRWRTILDDNYGRYFSVDELRRYPLDRLPFNGGPV